MARKKKYVYFFGGGKAEGKGDMKDLLGGKGAGLAEMTNIRVPVPPGFTITTVACTLYNRNKGKLPKYILEEVDKNLKKLEKAMGAKLGDPENPLLVSVRSGAKFSMPGMMDTVLNLGLNNQTIQGLIKKMGNKRFAYDCYRRFIHMFGNVVLGIPKDEFEHILTEKKKERGIKLDTELTAEDLTDLVVKYKALVKEKTGKEFPEDPYQQLAMARDAVFDSWNNPRAITYRKLHDIPEHLGTAVNVQAMVFGNMGNDSATGVAFTRDPSTGENKFYGEYLVNAQGEDVVAGIRTPKHLDEMKEEMPQIYKQLCDIRKKLERHYRDMQDIEFTIQQGKLYMLQTRTGKRTAQAAVKMAVDMAKEGLITKEEALLRVDPEQLDQLLHPMIDPQAKVTVIARGLPASPGAATGAAIFTADEAHRLGTSGERVILVRTETNPDDIHGMAAAQGILTARGGMTSHAAVVARGMGKPCVAGCEEIKVNEKEKKFTVGDIGVKEGDFITIDGSTGRVILGRVPTIEPQLSGEFAELMRWADKVRTLGVRANADLPRDAEIAREYGAEGIGLCRTEHMFFAEERLPIMQEMIIAKDEASRKEALAKLLPMQREDFKGLFKAMAGMPVVIRLLDPPLHEFLPRREDLLVEITKLRLTGGSEEEIAKKEELLHRVEALKEVNPMLGHRGCRLGVTFPEIYDMQVQAIFEAATEVAKEGYEVIPEVMIPVVGHVKELKLLKPRTVRIAEEVMKKAGVKLHYLVGTMIELPRAALTADEIAKEAEFFSFGTNDLTQTTFGFSRDDAEGKFLQDYIEKGVLEKDPFEVLDQVGVGELMRIGVEKGRKARPDLEVGICGEHGGEPSSVIFCHQIGLDYVSCSPFRVPIARLAAAQAKLGRKVISVTK